MEANEIIKAIRCHAGRFSGFRAKCNECPANRGVNMLCAYEEMLTDAADLIDQQQAELTALREATRWIPVSERLPEDCEELHFYDDGRLKFTSVLAVSGNEVRPRNRLIVRECGNAYLDEQVTDGWIWGTGEPVTHWMPLPAPPEKGSPE